MDIKKELIKIIKRYVNVSKDEIILTTDKVSNLSFKQLRDSLIGKGKIVDELFDEQVYIIRVKSGFAKMNEAIIAVKLTDDEIGFAGYAKEGLIKQHTASNAIEILRKEIIK